LTDFNFELHARPSARLSGPAFIEHIAFIPVDIEHYSIGYQPQTNVQSEAGIDTRLEFHTEFISLTRVTHLTQAPTTWPQADLTLEDAALIAGCGTGSLVSKTAILVIGEAPDDASQTLSSYGFKSTAGSSIGRNDAEIFSDFVVGADGASKLLLFNNRLNSFRLGRMVRRLLEIETYRAMALLALPEARRLAPLIAGYDRSLMQLSKRDITGPVADHRQLLRELSQLSAEVISAAAETRNRFSATVAYADIVDERIKELQETHVPGFQRYGIFIDRRFKPAVRTCSATAHRLEQLAMAIRHLIELLQTNIQVEIEFQNAEQIKATAERAATQIRIQRAVEGFSIIAISYYLLSLFKIALEAMKTSGVGISPAVMLISIPVVVAVVALSIARVKKAL
jgi:uncharacterized membrane-anchored protein